WEIATEHPVYVIVAHAQYLGHKPSEHSHHQAARHRLNPNRGFRKPQENGADLEQQLYEANRSEPADDPEDRVNAKLHGMNQTIRGNMEQRLIAEQQVQDNP